MATITKNFKIKNGLIVEGSTATVNGNDVLTKSAADTTYIQGLVGGVANSQSVANAIVLRDANASFSANVVTADLVGDVTGTVSDISNHDTDALAEGATNKYFANSLARQALNGGTGITYDNSTGEISVTSNTYDAYGAAANAQSAAETYADGVADTAQTNAQNYADGVASTAQTNAQNYADGLASNYDAAGSADTAQTNAVTIANDYTDDAVANLVNGAPELLDTLNELAAALDDNPNVIADLQGIAAGKQDALTAGTGIDIVGNTISVTSNTYDAYGSADTAQTNAQNYADGLATNYDPAGSASTAQTNAQNYADNAINALTTDDIEEGSTNLYFSNSLAVGALEAVTPNFQSVDITWVRREEATWTDATTAGAHTAHTFSSVEGSVKYLVRIFNSGNSQVSEVLVTTDSSNNIAVTEYAIIYTSENPLATVTADWDSGNSVYRLRVTTANNNSEILVAATMLAYND